MPTDPSELETLEGEWRSRWQAALAAWSRFTKLRPPVFCHDRPQERAEGLDDAIAMIRLDDHSVVIGLRRVRELGLAGFPLEILAHEVGHHVLAPADLQDNARLLARIRAMLPEVEEMAPLVSNLYTDLLINDRLQRSAELDLVAVYRRLRTEESGPLWSLYMMIYEDLWGLPQGTLTPAAGDPRRGSDARLGARLVRVYARDWLTGSGRFAALCLPYLERAGEEIAAAPWLDTARAGAGESVPDGLVEIAEGEEPADGVHPACDPLISGLPAEHAASEALEPGEADARAILGGLKNRYRTPTEYRELMESVGVTVGEARLLVRYYRERAAPHLVPFPVREGAESTDPLPEALDTWDVGSEISAVDWVETLMRSKTVIPGVTTVQRRYGTTQGDTPDRAPLDLYLGVDCSGSMANPAHGTSWPVIAGAVVLLSALRAGARAMVCLSGAPGSHSETRGFVRDEDELLRVLTGYLGTGYAYGIDRLEKTFLAGDRPKRPTHLLIVTDADIFHMLGQLRRGWEIAREALEVAAGGGTMVLDMREEFGYRDEVERLREQGWKVHFITGGEDLVAFARAFARQTYPERRPR